MELGERLAKVRKEKGFKQKDLAERLNMSQQVISNIERNATAPDIEFLSGVADLYGIRRAYRKTGCSITGRRY